MVEEFIMCLNNCVFFPPCAEVLDEDKMNVELVVQCVRVSDMPQTHHHALLLLGTVAGIFPVSSAPLWNMSTSVF